MLFFATTSAQSAELRAVGIAELSDGTTAIVMDATSIFAIKASALAVPKRLMLDFEGVALAAATRAGKGGGLVQDFRLVQHEKGISTRLVLDLAKPALAGAIDVIPGPVGVRMILRLEEQSKTAFLEAATATQQQALNLVEDENGIDPVITGTTAKPVVVLDPGHGGVDPGASTATAQLEKELVLAFGLALRDALMATGQFDVVMTRDKDVSLSLNDRVGLAREKKAALFVSLHADSLQDADNVRGASVYTLADRASDARSARLADRENGVDATYGIQSTQEDQNVSDILFDLTRRETRNFSNRFAEMLVSELKSSITVNKTPRRFARFRVLTAPDVPSVLLELGFLSSQDDAAQLADPAWRATAAKSAANAIEDFLMEPVETLPMPTTDGENAVDEGDASGAISGSNATQPQ